MSTINTTTTIIDIPKDFKSTLPPRKRAKTKEEKEQRRIERILRNRKAAHQSREKKRLHLKFLEYKCDLMESLLTDIDLLTIFKDDESKLEKVNEYLSMKDSKDVIENEISFIKNKDPSLIDSQEEDDDENHHHNSNNKMISNDTIVKLEETEIKLEDVSSIVSTSLSPFQMISPMSNITLETDKEDIFDSGNNYSYNTKNSTSPLDVDDSFEKNKNWDLLMNKDDQDDSIYFELDTTDFTQTNNSNNLLNGSYDLDNWRNPAAITN
ncbi:hypothetical protein KAFR_0C03510 [Kazachstania africana CBS 2517]|uniref:BZIP domain-containing protein n=1 Tax=Kazachstania africana (strain ATCC 22294 / BCRC 22015 / CBS 2517 / CECT 1963 / NBRC 1671 / NRRL Y-8276) TaxID=1071382 RepID=H2ASJ3_KAZAF|nr:hypothetical protein KAFR_0C03510 [Kazachstania africana CBS 2517]CCF57343.1 hypothetical protein KAFR_0C03510 [Kazachstania africana CBS 2517]